MSAPKSFFKNEAIFTMLFQIAMPLLGLIFVAIVLFWRWLSR
jgi:hypothetical protein